MTFTKEDCTIWKKEPLRNPRNKRKLNPDAKKGIYNQLVKLCSILLKEPEPAVPTTDDNLEADRLRLIRAIRKAIKPIIHKIDTTEMRVKYNTIIGNYIKNIQPCLQESVIKNTNTLVLVDKTNSPIITFDKQIGSKSAYGMAYMNAGRGFAKLLKFSCKLMDVTSDNTREIKVLRLMSKAVIKGITPNMPLTYNYQQCKVPCKIQSCPSVTKYGKYYIVMSELANCDIQNWLKDTYSENIYTSVILQLLFAIQAFHNMDYIHQDTHLGNFLIHKIKPGGYWHYKFNNDIDIYVPNLGYLLVIWDPGLAKKMVGKIVTQDIWKDYSRPLRLMNSIDKNETYIEWGLKPLPINVKTMNVLFVNNLFKMSLYDIFKTQVIDQAYMTGILINTPPIQSLIINAKPYVLTSTP